MSSKNIRFHAVALAAIMVGWAFIAAAQTPTMIRLDYSIVQTHVTPQGQPIVSSSRRVEYIAADGRMRTEDINAQTGAVTRVTIEEPARHSVIQLDPATKTATRISQTGSGIPSKTLAGPIQAQKRDLGTVTIDGFPCHRYLNTVANISSVEVSWCQDAASRQTFIGSLVGTGGSALPSAALAPGQGKTKQTLERVTRNLPLDNSLFEIPAGYQAAGQ